jgi:hypothetical protein
MLMKKTLLLIPALALGAVAAHGQVLVIYEEAFLRVGNPTSGDRLLNQSWDGGYQGNWRTYDAAGNNEPNGNTGGVSRQRLISQGNGNDGTPGFLFMNWNALNFNASRAGDPAVSHGIVFRDETPVFNTELPDYTAAHLQMQNLREFRIDMSRGTNDAAVNASARAVIQIGTDWFASEQGFNPTESGSPNIWQTFTLPDISTANWLTLSFDSDNNNAVTLGNTAMTLAAHGVAGDAILVSVGIHASTTATAAGGDATGQYRMDNIVVTAIPEPSTYAALFGLLAIGFVAYRRRRR